VNSTRTTPQPAVAASRQRPSHILIITDDATELADVEELLRRQLFKVSRAAGWQGYHRAHASTPDLILVDRAMRKMDGFMLGRLLKQSMGTCDIPCIFLLETSQKGENLEAFAVGAVDCLTKPFYPEELLARISVHLRTAISSRRSAATATPSSHITALRDDILLRNALGVIQTDPDIPHSVRDLAKRVGTNERRLSNVFKSKMGFSTHKFLLARKIEVARHLLANTGMPIHEVAQHVGFHSVCNFTVAFRRDTGVTPSLFRNSRGHSQDASAALPWAQSFA
jgi:DNA-binding response OmpR family regulator